MQSTTTFDLFGAEHVALAPPAPPAAKSYVMKPTGRPNEWTYRDVLLTCDMKRAGFVDHWSTIEQLGSPPACLKSDRRVLLCQAIDFCLDGKERRYA